jgi:hypothetical protein
MARLLSLVSWHHQSQDIFLRVEFDSFRFGCDQHGRMSFHYFFPSFDGNLKQPGDLNNQRNAEYGLRERLIVT